MYAFCPATIHFPLLTPNQHVSTRMDDTTQTQNPFLGKTNISYGVYNPNHTSTASLHYPQGKLLTPWHFLLASLLWSVILSVVGLASAAGDRAKYRRDALSADIKGRLLLALGGLFITTLRLGFLVVFVAQQQKTTGPPSPSGLLLFLLSIVPYARNMLLPKWLNWTAFVEFLAGAIIMCWLFAHTITKTGPGSWVFDGFGYARLIITGGNCPSGFANATCSEMKSIISYSGCSNQTRFPNYTTPVGNYTEAGNIGVEEAIYEIIGLVVIAIALLFFLNNWILDSRKSSKEMQPRSTMTRDDRKYWQIHWIQFIVLAVIILTFQIVSTCVVVPIQASGEASPISQATFVILDSFGPYIPNVTNPGNSTSWTDCFEVLPPSDKYGFAGFWWKTEKLRALRVLSGL